MTLIVTAESHLDHGLSAAHLSFIFKAFEEVAQPGLVIVTLGLPEELPGLPCALCGPLVGENEIPESVVRYAKRGDRSYESRLIDSTPLTSRQVSVIAGPHGDYPHVLYTAFGGPVTPREPGDPSLPEEERAESEEFWSKHALAAGS